MGLKPLSPSPASAIPVSVCLKATKDVRTKTGPMLDFLIYPSNGVWSPFPFLAIVF